MADRLDRHLEDHYALEDRLDRRLEDRYALEDHLDRHLEDRCALEDHLDRHLEDRHALEGRLNYRLEDRYALEDRLGRHFEKDLGGHRHGKVLVGHCEKVGLLLEVHLHLRILHHSADKLSLIPSLIRHILHRQTFPRHYLLQLVLVRYRFCLFHRLLI